MARSGRREGPGTGHSGMCVFEAMWDLGGAGTSAPAFESQREIAGSGQDCLGTPPSIPRHETSSAYCMTPGKLVQNIQLGPGDRGQPGVTSGPVQLWETSWREGGTKYEGGQPDQPPTPRVADSQPWLGQGPRLGLNISDKP